MWNYKMYWLNKNWLEVFGSNGLELWNGCETLIFLGIYKGDFVRWCFKIQVGRQYLFAYSSRTLSKRLPEIYKSLSPSHTGFFIKKQPSDTTIDSSVGSSVPPTSKLFLSGCRRRPSEKTAIQVRYVQPFSVATLKWGLEGATKVRSLSRAMAVFFLKNPVSR